jgi:hypothetical protein
VVEPHNATKFGDPRVAGRRRGAAAGDVLPVIAPSCARSSPPPL